MTREYHEPATGDAVRHARTRLLVVDCVLAILALGSAVWACAYERCDVAPGTRRHVVLRSGTVDLSPEADLRQVLYVDSTNLIRTAEGVWDGPASLATGWRPVSDRVLLLVHPDGLAANVQRTVEVALRAGVRDVGIATCEATPFVD